MKKLIALSTILLTLFILNACGGSSNYTPPLVEVDLDGSTTINSNTLASNLNNILPSDLSAAEEESLAFMREEEKLARDVYTALHNIYGQKIFTNIAASEQTHTDAVLALIERYELVDPMQTDTFGIFVNSELQLIYDTLVTSGSISLLEGLFVGATVEELDIYDLQNQKDNVIDNADIIYVYDNLLKGSRNHLRSFDKQIKNNGGVYTPVYISQELYDSIINSSIERN
ncbi:DUF2202 domain-containing protein [Brumicola nitratireducens]|uniref:DUF2202 domain-containing protein n=1 Tax=Glaciecola nitratireducens (strain JCM 12485 / KCTC 12276 / FR1064) TaxID=1085623 RepID=G4QMK4_GLANF|nr:DUF2202 domain-containing protein [Glaciecola nitratireducens]AEP30956.1 hypothetical protein GNIT_2859 [Glaciecola nitratireducens FR1064]